MGTGIYVISSDGSESHRVGGFNDIWGRAPIWSSDEKWIAFYDNNAGWHVVDVDGNNLMNLTDNPGLDGLSDWSSDGDLFTFTHTHDGDQETYMETVENSKVRNLTMASAADFHPILSPDGTGIAFVSDRLGTNILYAMRADGVELEQLSPIAVAQRPQPVWSPDARLVAFVADGPEAHHDLWVINIETGVAQNLTHGVIHVAEDLIWSPNGEQILIDTYPTLAVSVRDGSIYELPSHSETGPDCPQHDQVVALPSRPAWSPDGRWIAYATDSHSRFGCVSGLALFNVEVLNSLPNLAPH
jgi:TolB protein